MLQPQKSMSIMINYINCQNTLYTSKFHLYILTLPLYINNNDNYSKKKKNMKQKFDTIKKQNSHNEYK